MELNILYQSSDSYAPLGGISIESLLQNNRDAEAIHIYYLEDNVSAQNRQKLEDTVKKYGRTLSFYSLKRIEEMVRQRGGAPLSRPLCHLLQAVCPLPFRAHNRAAFVS